MKACIATLITIGMLALGISAVVAQSGNDLFQQALVKERTEGNPAAAIALYQTIVNTHKTDRALVAKALVQIGQCYEKLGRSDAIKTYERVVREFGDQKESVATARARLAEIQAPATTQPGPATRRIWDNVNQWSYNVRAPSADGRYLSFTGDWGDLGILDLVEGTSRYLTNLGAKTNGSEEAEESLVAPDGRHVAYGWSPGDGFDLRILPVSDQFLQPRILHRSDETIYMAPVGWTPDGKSLLVTRELRDATGQIAFISLADGSLRVLKSFVWNQMGDISLSPDGRSIAYSAPAGPSVPEHDIFLLASDGSREALVVQNPGWDVQPVWSPDSSQILFLSNRTGNNSLWTVPVEAGKPQGAPEFVRAAPGRLLGVTRSGALYYVTGGPTTNIYNVELDSSVKADGAPVLGTARFVNGNSEPKWSRDGGSLAYRRGPTIVVRSVKSGDERPVPTSLAVALLAGWFPDGQSVLALSHSLEDGITMFHRVDITTGSTEMLFSVRDRRPPRTNSARPDLSPDGKHIFYVDRSQEPERLMRFDSDSRTAVELTRASGPGEAQQFVAVAVSPDGAHVAIRASGWLSVMPASGGELRRVIRPGGGGASSWELVWTPDQRHLLFMSRENEGGVDHEKKLFRVPVGGGVREEIGLTGNINFLAPHPGGRRLTYRNYDDRPFELWALENFLPKPGASK